MTTTAVPDPAETANALLAAGEAIAPLLDLVDGHREELARRGYSPAVAEAMALELYRHVIAAAFANVGRSK